MSLKIDIGCGSSKRAGFLGVDRSPGAGIDHVIDIERDPLPFADKSVGEIYSSHCFEHLSDQSTIFREISRVAKNGAKLEIWTPYAWTDEAFIYTHKTFFTELHYLHPCYLFPDHWEQVLGARWRLSEIQFVVSPSVLQDLRRQRVDIDFALKYLKGVATEFGAHLNIWHDDPPPATAPSRTYSFSREGERYTLPVSKLDRLKGLWARIKRSKLVGAR